MGHVGFLGRLLAILMVALLAAIVATVGIDRLTHPPPSRRGAVPFPRVVHAAGIIALVRGADAARRQSILDAANSDLLRVSIRDRPPPAEAGDLPAPHLGARLRAAIGRPIEGLEIYTDRRMARVGPRGAEGSLTKVVAPVGDGRTLLIEWRDPPEMAALTVLGLPPGVWVGVLGFAVAALALVATIREVRPLRRLTESVGAFDGGRPAAPVQEGGAPDIRRLIRAVRGMQERMAALLAERSFMIGAVSHDLKTYLTRLRLRTETVPDGALRERLVGDLDAMTRLIDTALAFSHGTTSTQNRVTLDLSDLVAVEVAEHGALGLAPALHAAYADDATVVGDPVALRRVVCNVLDNALKHARSAVTVRVTRTATHEHVVIADDGPGVPAAERASIFDPFHRVERARGQTSGGSGLGLAIACQIVEAHGGTIQLAADETAGARFTIALPARAATRAGKRA